MTKSVLLLGNHPPPYGGVPMHIQYLAPYLVERGWEVVVLSYAGGTRWGPDRIEQRGGYQIYRPARWRKWRDALIPDPCWPVPFRFGRLALRHPRGYAATVGNARLISQIARRHRVGLISAYHVMAGLPAAWVSEALAIPLVTTIFGEIYAQPDFYRRRRREVEYVCSVSKRVLSCSQHCARSLELIGVDRPVEAVHYGIDTRRFNPEVDGSVIKARLGISAHDSVVLFVGRMEAEMGLHVLLRSIAGVLEANRQVRFVVAGTRGALTNEAEVLAQSLPGNLFVATDVPFDELPLFYAAASVAVVPSINNRACLGLAIAEAMASGRAVIVADVGGGREVLTDEAAGRFVPPEEPSALAAAIIKVLANEEGLRAAGQVGRRIAVGSFDKDQTNSRMERVFREVTG